MDEDDDSARELFEEVERRAFLDLPEEDDDDEDVNLVAELAGTEPDSATGTRDLTLGGYIALHNRPPAFSGCDQQPYTVDIDVEATDEIERPYAAFLVFIRWAETGAGIMAHTESGNVAYGSSPDAARAAALDLTLYEIKSELDASIDRKRAELEE